jgi:hypothetical protein
MTTLFSTITCPLCGHRKTETMPTDACQYFYDCEGCHAVLKPKAGDCCVFCSYGSVPCPPVQAAQIGGEPASCCTSERPRADDHAGDWVSNARSFAIAWGLPTSFIFMGLFTGPTMRAALWTLALSWMGGACLLNARRCGRTHCRFTGPYYLAMIIPVLFLASGAVSASYYGWLVLGALILAGSKVIWWMTERRLGRYS